MKSSPSRRRGCAFPPDLAALLSTLWVCPFVALTAPALPVAPWQWMGLFLVISLLVALNGVGWLLRAKWPLYRQGRWLTFGPRSLPPACRGAYFRGWRRAATGCLMMLALIAALAG